MTNTEYLFLKTIIEKDVRTTTNTIFTMLVFGSLIILATFLWVPIVYRPIALVVTAIVGILLFVYYNILYNLCLKDSKRMIKLNQFYRDKVDIEVAIEGLGLLPPRLIKP